MKYKIDDGIFIIESSLFIEKLDLIVISDLQLGREEELRNKGHLIFDQELAKMKRRLFRIIKESGASRILINGDIKHEFARINKQEWDHILDLFDFISEKNIELILIKGNHDNMLEPIASKKGYKLINYYYEDDFFFCHGDQLINCEEFDKSKFLIIGHEHPALKIDDGVRSETAKCFLHGSFNKKELFILPSFSEFTYGTNILNQNFLSPFIKNIKKYAVYVLIENTVLRFGTVRDVQSAF